MAINFIKQNLEVIMLSLGLLATLSSWYTWYNSSLKKRYAAEADFKKLKLGQKEFTEKLSSIEIELQEIKIILATQQRAGGEDISGILRRISDTGRDKTYD